MIVDFDAFHLQHIEATIEVKASMELLAKWPGASAWTFVEGGKITAIAGVIGIHPGNMEVWVHITPDIERHKLSTLKDAGKQLNKVKAGVDRLQASVKADFEQGKAFVSFFGFKCEGLMRKFKDGEDYYMYSLTE